MHRLYGQLPPVRTVSLPYPVPTATPGSPISGPQNTNLTSPSDSSWLKTPRLTPLGSVSENFPRVNIASHDVKLVGGATPCDPAGPTPAATTPASPAPDLTGQPLFYGSLASSQHLEVLYGDQLSTPMVPPISSGTTPPEIFPNIGLPVLNHGTTFTPAHRLSSKPILSPHGIPVPSSGAIPPVQMRSVQHGRFQGQFSGNFMVQTPSSPHNHNYLPKCF